MGDFKNWIDDIDFQKPVKIDVRKLSKIYNPFKAWIKSRNPITRQEIVEAIRKNDLIPPNAPKKTEMIWDVSPRKDHIARIAWLVKNYNEKYPIEIDFGMPQYMAGISVEDGNHRLAAAMFLNKPYVWAKCGGEISVIKSFLYAI